MSTDPGMETPVAPIPAPTSRRRRDRERPPPAREKADDVPTFFGPFRSGVGFAMRGWKVVLLVLLVHLALAMTVVLPFQSRMAERLDSHAHAPAMAGAPDAYDRAAGWDDGGLAYGVWQDAKRLEKPLLDSQRITVFWIALVAWLFGALVSGGYLGVRQSGARMTVSGFLEAGGRAYGRMLRVGLVFAIAYYIVATLVLVLWARAVSVGEAWSNTSESSWWGEQWRVGLVAVLFLWFRVAADLARADLVRTGRKSALLAFFRGFCATLRHPLKTFGLAIFIGVPALLIVLGIGVLLNSLVTTTTVELLLAFFIIQLAVFIRLLARAAVLAGSHQLVNDFDTAAA